MPLQEIQEQVDRWTSQYTPQYWPPYQIFARLMEECGELGRELNHMYGHKKKKPEEDTRNLGEEIGDILVTLCCLANSHNINLDEAFQRVMEKMQIRDADRFQKKV